MDKSKTIDIEVGPMQKMFIFGASDRVSNIIGKRGYNKILDALDSGDTDKLETLHLFIGWALEYLHEQNS